MKDHTNAGIVFMDPKQCGYKEGGEDQEEDKNNGSGLADIFVALGVAFAFFVFVAVVVASIFILENFWESNLTGAMTSIALRLFKQIS